MTKLNKKKRFLLPLATLSLASLLVGSSYVGNEKTALAETITFPQGEAFDNGGYSGTAGLPVVGNWSYNLPVAGTETNKVKWSKEIGYNSLATPTVDKDGNIYISDLNGQIISYDKDGNEHWRSAEGLKFSGAGSLVIGKDNTLYAAGLSNLYAFNADGSVKWKTSFTGSFSTPSIDSHGVIYSLNNTDRKLYAINPDGSMKWKTVDLKDTIGDNKAPLISKDGTIYVQGDANTGHLAAIDQNGGLKWQILASGYQNNISLLPSGEVILPKYSAGNKGSMRLINPVDGTTSKTITFANTNGGRFVLYSQYNKELIVSDYYAISSYNLDGTLNWTYQTNGEVRMEPIIDKNGVIYFSGQDGDFTALNPNGQVKWHVDLKQYFGTTSIGFNQAPISMGVDTSGNFYMVAKINKTTGSTYNLFAIGGESEPVIEEPCMGYLETIDQKVKDDTITQEEIDEAQARLNDTLTQLNEKETK